MPTVWKKAKVTHIEQLSTTTRSFLLEVEDREQFTFSAGQFVTFDLPISERKSKRLRSYSIASSPNLSKGFFELAIVLAINGEGGSRFFFDEVKQGSILRYKGPQGNFVLPQEIHRDIYFICTGTGIAPFRSMLYELLEYQQIKQHHFCLIFGCRTRKEAIYMDEMRDLQMKYSNFTYLPVLSREDWDGYTGHVHAVYQEVCNQELDADFYLCGWRNMVDEARAKLAAMGYDKQRIFFELYG